MRVGDEIDGFFNSLYEKSKTSVYNTHMYKGIEIFVTFITGAGASSIYAGFPGDKIQKNTSLSITGFVTGATMKERS